MSFFKYHKLIRGIVSSKHCFNHRFLKDLIPDYPIRVLAPASLEKNDLVKFKTVLLKVLWFLKFDRYDKKLREWEYLEDNFRNIILTGDAVRVLNVYGKMGLTNNEIAEFERLKEGQKVTFMDYLVEKRAGNLVERVARAEEDKARAEEDKVRLEEENVKLRTAYEKIVLNLKKTKGMTDEQISSITNTPLEVVQSITV